VAGCGLVSCPSRLASRTGPALIWVLICCWTAAWGWSQRRPSGVSWHFFPYGVHALFGPSGTHLYAEHPDLQIGPLAFVVTAPLVLLPDTVARIVAQLAMTAAGPAMLAVLSPLLPGTASRHRLRLLLAGLVLAPAWTALSVRWMHLEDVLALVFLVAAMRAVAGRRQVVAGLALAAAVASKPWAVGFLPILAVLPRRRAGSALRWAAAGIFAAWGPFLLCDIGTLHALRPPLGVSGSSGLRALGYRGGATPAWGRTIQLVAAPVAGLGAVLRRRWAGVPLAVIALRIALDPQDLPYYVAGAVLAALAFDLLVTNWTAPWTALVTSLALWQPFATDFPRRFETSHGLVLWWFEHPDAVGYIHLAWFALILLTVLAVPGRWLSPRGEAPTGAADSPATEPACLRTGTS